MENEISEFASVTVGAKAEGSHLFVVENYSRHRGIGAGEAIESEEFIVGGHRWTIRFFPGGTTVAVNKAGFASLHINLNSQEASKPVPYLFAVYFVDQSGKGNDWILSSLDGEVYRFAKTGVGMCDDSLKRKVLDHPDYLRNDCLKIYVTLRVVTCQNQNLPVISVPEPNIGADFGKLLQSKQGADLFFKVGDDEIFCAHKWILAARCSVFLSRFSDRHQTKEIDIPDMEPKIFKAMLWFVYTGTLPEQELDDSDFSPSSLLVSFLGKMLQAADRYQFKALKKLCELRISQRISRQSVPYVLHLAELCRAKELKEACIIFGAENGAGLLDVMDSDGWRYIKETCPSLFIELAYNPINEHQGHYSRNRFFSFMKDYVVGTPDPRFATDKRKDI